MKNLLIATFALAIALTPIEEEYNDTYLSEEIISYCEEIGEMYDVIPEFLEAIIEAESSGKQSARNGNCIGLMQVNKYYHSDRAEKLEADLNDEYGNILVGTDLLMELTKEHNNIAIGLARYHGERNAVSNGNKGIYSKYVRKILERSSELERAHGK